MSSNYTFYCEICNKYYKSIQSLSNHKSRYHKKSKPKVNIEDTIGKPKVNINHASGKPKVNIYNDINNEEDNIKYYKCNFCDKKYSYKQSKYRHQKSCKENFLVQNEKLKQDVENIREEVKEQLIEILKKECKMHPKTLQKINKQLLQQNNSGNINNGTINNITNYNIIQLGEENLLDVLSKREQIMILNKKHQSLNHYIEMVHFNDNFPQFKNIAVTNMKDNLAYMYDNRRNKFIAVKKDELLDTVIEMRMLDIEDFYNNNENELDTKTKANIKKFIDKMSKDNKYYEFKKSDIKLLLYNNSDSNVIKNLEC
jgi:hypothetical protein